MSMQQREEAINRMRFIILSGKGKKDVGWHKKIGIRNYQRAIWVKRQPGQPFLP